MEVKIEKRERMEQMNGEIGCEWSSCEGVR